MNAAEIGAYMSDGELYCARCWDGAPVEEGHQSVVFNDALWNELDHCGRCSDCLAHDLSDCEMPEAFFTGYADALLWQSTGDDGEPLDRSDYSTDEIAESALAEIRRDCEDFWRANTYDMRLTHANVEQHGHDFCLTRNGHGAGFWDRGYGVVGDRLTKA